MTQFVDVKRIDSGFESIKDSPNQVDQNLRFVMRREISNNVVGMTSKGSGQPVHMRSLFRVFASRLNNL